MLSNKEAVVQAVESCSEIGVAGLSQRLHLDKGTVRKVALEAAKEGRIGARNNGQGYVFFSAAGQTIDQDSVFFAAMIRQLSTWTTSKKFHRKHLPLAGRLFPSRNPQRRRCDSTPSPRHSERNAATK
jgi:hypothetical protein